MFVEPNLINIKAQNKSNSDRYTDLNTGLKSVNKSQDTH